MSGGRNGGHEIMGHLSLDEHSLHVALEKLNQGMLTSILAQTSHLCKLTVPSPPFAAGGRPVCYFFQKMYDPAL